MRQLLLLLALCALISGCEDSQSFSSLDPVNWQSRTVPTNPADSLATGTTYLSVYSSVYSLTEHKTHSLTVMVSIRNTNRTDTVYVDQAEYFNTTGHLIRTYFNRHIYIAPMETVEIVIDERDKEGGTGANFLFEWAAPPTANPPLFEAVMISTSGQQGLSFTTTGVAVN
ncbi:hypothetical protein GGR28_003199 [Lewinella aquimaris]|uniref:DUF3124 domain-containing protein n=1 Tax=Neolewinella aquimaris TaxID=1835722 RepID=A0A840E4K8_9BACT|nr:DUF3124 domain-containing protein [Neolewinella aquimaris]MBB4080564.1 hypothetical protein [Neolewinella aquimaris]